MPDNMTRFPVRHSARDRQRRYRVTLVCGCALLMRDHPLNVNTRFSCESGAGHGYRLAWASALDLRTGTVWPNRLTDSSTAGLVPVQRESRPAAACELVRFEDVVVGDRVHFSTQLDGIYGRIWQNGTVTGFSKSGESFRVTCDDGRSSRISRTGYANRCVKRYI